MDIKTLESFKLSDAVKFHDELNPKLWDDNELRPEIKKQLLLIAEDFLVELGIGQLNVEDITISGSNAAYSYTPHSDLDLHILVDMNKLPNNEVYKELFMAKKNLYNDSHDIKVHGVPVELYVQDSNEPVVSLGEYSILKNKWLKIPIKRRANFDQTVTKEKYKKLLRVIRKILKTKDLSKLENVVSTIKRYRKAGLDKGGEFGPENLAYKALRTQGYIDKLYQLKNKLHSQDLSIEENIFYNDPKQLIDLYVREIDTTDFSKVIHKKVLQNLPYDNLDNAINFLKKKYNIKSTDVVWQPSGKTNEDYDPNSPPPGPEFKPTMPAGTVRVDVSDVYDWYKLGQHISNMKGLGKHDFGKGPPSTILSFGDEDTEHKYIKDLMKTGLSTTDIDPAGHKKIKGQKTDPTFNVNEKINPEITKPGFTAEKTIKTAKGPIKLVASTPSDSTEVFPQFYIKGFNEQGRPVSYLRLNMRDLEKFSLLPWKKKDFKNSFLVAGNVSVYDDYKRLGIASEMYKFAKELGNDIKPSETQTDAGKAMWRGFEKNKVVGEEEKPKQASKSGIYSTDVYGMTAYHSKCLEPGCDWESKRYDSIKLAQNAAQKHAQKHFKKGVTEAFDQPYKLKWEKSEHGDYDALATLDDGTYLTIMFNNEYKKNWMVEFYRNNSQEVTGEGDAQRIFATVLAAIKQFITKKKPESLFFSAVKEDDPTGSRTKLYDRLVQRYASNLGYNIQKQEHPGQMAYKLTRISNVKESASGYIPSHAEKNDPRFKTALTVDIKPDTMKKDAKKFGNKISRAGIPPTLKPSGKF